MEANLSAHFPSLEADPVGAYPRVDGLGGSHSPSERPMKWTDVKGIATQSMMDRAVPVGVGSGAVQPFRVAVKVAIALAIASVSTVAWLMPVESVFAYAAS